jgi:cytochrome c-type biogenesis protein CcmE
MLPARKRRLAFVLLLILCVSLALALALFALNQNINLFFTPAQTAKGEAPLHHPFRIGGIVKTGSVHHTDGLNVVFILEDKDKKHDIKVFYNGLLPALFREGQGIIVEGQLNPRHLFIASQVLAKHGETYRPKSENKS